MEKKEVYEAPVVEMHQVLLEQAIAGSVQDGKHEDFFSPDPGGHEGMIDDGDRYTGSFN